MDRAQLWVYLAEQPLLWLTVTLIAYMIGHQAFVRSGSRAVVNPVAIAALLLAGLLVLTGTPYAEYFEGAQFVHFLLGPATIALAWPLYQNFARIRRLIVPMLAALLVGSVVSVGSAVAIAYSLGAPGEVWLSVAPKSVTSPVAMGVAEKIGGLPTLTAGLVIITGIIGAILVTPLLDMLRIKDWRARGMSVGVAAHGIGTARAFQVSPVAGVFAATAMVLNALITALVASLLVTL